MLICRLVRLAIVMTFNCSGHDARIKLQGLSPIKKQVFLHTLSRYTETPQKPRPDNSVGVSLY